MLDHVGGRHFAKMIARKRPWKVVEIPPYLLLRRGDSIDLHGIGRRFFSAQIQNPIFCQLFRKLWTHWTVLLYWICRAGDIDPHVRHLPPERGRFQSFTLAIISSTPAALFATALSAPRWGAVTVGGPSPSLRPRNVGSHPKTSARLREESTPRADRITGRPTPSVLTSIRSISLPS